MSPNLKMLHIETHQNHEDLEYDLDQNHDQDQNQEQTSLKQIQYKDHGKSWDQNPNKIKIRTTTIP